MTFLSLNVDIISVIPFKVMMLNEVGYCVLSSAYHNSLCAMINNHWCTILKMTGMHTEKEKKHLVMICNQVINEIKQVLSLLSVSVIR